MDHRLVELETKIAFLEEALSTLSDVVSGQGNQLDKLQRSVVILGERLQQVIAHVDAGSGPANETPPHY